MGSSCYLVLRVSGLGVCQRGMVDVSEGEVDESVELVALDPPVRVFHGCRSYSEAGEAKASNMGVPPAMRPWSGPCLTLAPCSPSASFASAAFVTCQLISPVLGQTPAREMLAALNRLYCLSRMMVN
eukprot:767188-Hanusia_phi.AAC.13